MRLDMSIREIIDNCEDVVSRLIEYEFKKHGIEKIRQIGKLKKVSYSLLA